MKVMKYRIIYAVLNNYSLEVREGSFAVKKNQDLFPNNKKINQYQINDCCYTLFPSAIFSNNHYFKEKEPLLYQTGTEIERMFNEFLFLKLC
ncbi:hypothetical protein J2S09_001692 [Bacillus fengqiuensis]|nr:hypothetical protein [Bacillus fengqiuensis]